jgi:hypothetical protein
MPTPKADVPDAVDPDGESELRGGTLDGPEQQRAVGDAVYKKKHNPDTVLRVDDETDSLYDDGIELDDGTPPLGTDGSGTTPKSR